MSSIVYGGLDVHQKMITAYLFCRESGEVLSEQVPNERERLLRAARRWSKWGELRLCYEASGAGYVLKRWLDAVGIACEVIAPSRIPRAPGERIKTDRRDARKLATLYSAGVLAVVRVPDPQEEMVRALVRLHAELTQNMTRAKNRIRKYLTTLGYRYPGKNWGQKHRAWLKALALERIPRLIVQTHLEELDRLLAQRQEVDRQIAEVAQQERYWHRVQRLLCLRSIGVYSAMVLLTEIGDVRRFARAPQLMSYFGLVPKEDSSGESRRQGGITKAGSGRARWVLTEAAWNQRRPPGQSVRLRQQWQTQPEAVVAIAHQAQERLHRKFWKVALRKGSRTAAVAVAREMAGFVWALLSVEVD
jgi:transposase